MKEFLDTALNTATANGADYADIRISRHKNQSIRTRENRIQGISNSESYGFGVRVLVDGTWGFAASHRLTKNNVANITMRAMEIARANRVVQRIPIHLAEVESYEAQWNSPIKKDPFEVSINEKIDLLLTVNAEALKIKGAKYCSSSMLFMNEDKHFASTEGSVIHQNLHRAFPSFTVKAIDSERGEFETRAVDVLPMGLGYEYVEQSNLVEQAPKMAEEAVRKLTAKSVEPGPKDLILHPSHLWLTIH